MARLALLVPLCASLTVASCRPAPADTPFARARGLRLEPVVAGLRAPVHLAAPAGDPRLFIVEQPGRILIVKRGRLLARPFLDIRDRVRAGGERGLLAVAFHPGYSKNGFFFVNYTDPEGATRIERYRVGSDPDLADPESARLVLRVEQPYANHNGGHLLFGPDGMLYVGMGDGGSGGDPRGHAQNLASLLGKLLRLDVDRASPYGVPPDNPGVERAGQRPEIWAWGLRNPWRFAFDPPAGLLYIADVGQDLWEEVHVAPADRAGLNYGWNVLEGSHCFGSRDCDREGLELPVVEYPHEEGCSITGGSVYRGRSMPGLAGHYFFSDYCRGWIRSFRYEGGRVRDAREWEVGPVGSVTSFGVDGTGELYVLTMQGRVSRLAWRR